MFINLRKGREMMSATDYESGRVHVRNNLHQIIAYESVKNRPHTVSRLYRLINGIFVDYEDSIMFIKYVEAKKRHLSFLLGIGNNITYAVYEEEAIFNDSVVAYISRENDNVLMEDMEEYSPLTLCWTTDKNIAINSYDTYKGRYAYYIDIVGLLLKYRYYYNKYKISISDFIFKHVLPLTYESKLEYQLYRYHIYGKTLYYDDMSPINMMDYSKLILKYSDKFRRDSLRKKLKPNDYIANSFYINRKNDIFDNLPILNGRGTYNFLAIYLDDIMKILSICYNNDNLKFEVYSKITFIKTNKSMYNTNRMKKRLEKFRLEIKDGSTKYRK